MKYKGYTYCLPELEIIYFLWKKFFCKRGWHLWDEVKNSCGDHYLYCDACEEEINIQTNNQQGEKI